MDVDDPQLVAIRYGFYCLNRDLIGMRFGQWYYNTFMAGAPPWPELFYEEDEKKAYALLSPK